MYLIRSLVSKSNDINFFIKDSDLYLLYTSNDFSIIVRVLKSYTRNIFSSSNIDIKDFNLDTINDDLYIKINNKLSCSDVEDILNYYNVANTEEYIIYKKKVIKLDDDVVKSHSHINYKCSPEIDSWLHIHFHTGFSAFWSSIDVNNILTEKPALFVVIGEDSSSLKAKLSFGGNGYFVNLIEGTLYDVFSILSDEYKEKYKIDYNNLTYHNKDLCSDFYTYNDYYESDYCHLEERVYNKIKYKQRNHKYNYKKTITKNSSHSS